LKKQLKFLKNFLDIHPKCLMIHVKKPEELFPEKKKLKGKKKGVENITRYVEPNDGQNEVDEVGEDGFDVFQNNIGIILVEYKIYLQLFYKIIITF